MGGRFRRSATMCRCMVRPQMARTGAHLLAIDVTVELDGPADAWDDPRRWAREVRASLAGTGSTVLIEVLEGHASASVFMPVTSTNADTVRAIVGRLIDDDWTVPAAAR